VSFYKRLVDSTGHPVDAYQGVVEIRARDPERAIKDGRQSFARLRQIGDWSIHADYETVEALPNRKQRGLLAQASRTCHAPPVGNGDHHGSYQGS
jgi:hypothetical protein